MKIEGSCGLLAVAMQLALHTQSAWACGGCFVPPTPPQETQTPSIITDEKMILSVSMSQTTLYDQINYSGSPASFAWVLPIKGTVSVGLSADIMFQTINQLTATTITSPPQNCPPAPSCGGGSRGCGLGGSSSATIATFGPGEGALPDTTVMVISQAQVGPYEAVQLASTDGSALTNWLTAHGYDIPDDTKPVILAYVSQGFDFLALKLVPGVGVQSMQPVRVTTMGASPTLPLHMVSVGTGPTTGITIWVVADGRWEPSNFPTFTVDASELVWDWTTSSSNYETVRLAKEATYGGRGWQIESSLDLSQYTISSALQQAITSDPTGLPGGYLAPIPATLADAGGGDGGASDVGDPGDAGEDAGEQLTAANADLAVLFYGIAAPNVRITRMRSDVAKSALSVDMVLQASSDQSELTNQLVAEQESGEPQCPIYDGSCNQIGTAPRSQAQAASSGGGCATARPREGFGTTFAFALGLGGIVFARVRVRRSRHRR